MPHFTLGVLNNTVKNRRKLLYVVLVLSSFTNSPWRLEKPPLYMHGAVLSRRIHSQATVTLSTHVEDALLRRR